MPGTWQGSHWSAIFYVTGMTPPGKIMSQAGFKLQIFRSRGGHRNHKANEAVAFYEYKDPQSDCVVIPVATVLPKLLQGVYTSNS